MIIDARQYGWQALNELVRGAKEDVVLQNCCGERFIGCAMSGKRMTVDGVPGNALGAYLDGGEILCRKNVQDAVGDTMNDGRIIVYGSAGDALGYAMRGGSIYVRGDSGYRTGIHMKQYMDKRPVIVVGGKAGSFLGEYLAGGLIIVLGIGCDGVPAGNFIGTGMHGGEIWLRCEKEPERLPAQVAVSKADRGELSAIEPFIKEYCGYFGRDEKEILSQTFWRLTPNAKNPYKRLYTQN